jgi:hypothetical protein
LFAHESVNDVDSPHCGEGVGSPTDQALRGERQVSGRRKPKDARDIDYVVPGILCQLGG